MNNLRKILAQEDKNLVTFFRQSDFKGRWTVGR